MAAARGELLIEDTFTGYPDNALISDSPAGDGVGLTGDWTLDQEGDFYVNRTQSDLTAGTDKAVYDRPSDDNGARSATRSTSDKHVLYENDGDEFYASFLIDPARTGGSMTFELELEQISGGGAPNFAFGIDEGTYIVGNGGVNVDASGGTVTASEQLVLVRIEYGDGGAANFGGDEEIVTLWVDPVNESSTPVINETSVDFLNRGGGKVLSV